MVPQMCGWVSNEAIPPWCTQEDERISNSQLVFELRFASERLGNPHIGWGIRCRGVRPDEQDIDGNSDAVDRRASRSVSQRGIRSASKARNGTTLREIQALNGIRQVHEYSYSAGWTMNCRGLRKRTGAWGNRDWSRNTSWAHSLRWAGPCRATKFA